MAIDELRRLFPPDAAEGPRLLEPADPERLRARTLAAFEARFGDAASVYASAPGRVNLIGEHTDYSQGFALPMAIARATGVAAALRTDGRVRVGSALADEIVELHLEGAPGGAPRWTRYARGVLVELARHGVESGGFDAWIESDVPLGAGLSSSAALEVALARAVEALAGRELDVLERARICRRAEQEHVGVPCGILDQLASSSARAQRLLFLDCRSERFEEVALASEAELAIVDSRLPHDLGHGAYAERVAECAEAARVLGVAALRDATVADVDRLQSRGLATLARRARHVVEENRRTCDAVAAIRDRDWNRLGRLLDESHASLRDLYQVSRPEMDDLVERLRLAGALGARMTGGGFGGSAVALIPRRAEDRLASSVLRSRATRDDRRH